MKYDFTSILVRKGYDALAIDALGEGNTPIPCPPRPKAGFEPIPMWVADMNFPTVPAVPEKIIERAKHAAYGYFLPRSEYYDSIIRWHENRNGVQGLTQECIGYENGVLGGVISALNVFCSKGDNVLIHSPTYIGFTNSLNNNGYHIIHSELVHDEQGIWRMDFEDMERKIVENRIHAAIMCSPHNPCGRVWERWELEQAMELYRKHDVFVVSDEIWSDFILDGYKHIPTQSVSEDAKNRTIALYAPSKTFNLAGLVGSYHIAYNKYLRERLRKESSLCHYNDMNVLSMHALIGAYSSEGNTWVDELLQVINDNVEFAVNYIKTRFNGISVCKPQGTYMLFLDCSEWCRNNERSIDELQKAGWDVGVVWQDGRNFRGPHHIRMNLALPHALVREAFERLDRYVFNV